MNWGKGQANVVLVINVAAPQAFRLVGCLPTPPWLKCSLKRSF